MGHANSFNDLSMGAQADVQEHFQKPQSNTEQPDLARNSAEVATPRSPMVKQDVWQSVFNPGRNYKTAPGGRSSYDNVGADKSPTTWDMHLQSQNPKK